MPEYLSGCVIIIQPSEQWASRVMCKVHKMHHEENFDTNHDGALLHIHSTFIGPGLPSPAEFMLQC